MIATTSYYFRQSNCVFGSAIMTIVYNNNNSPPPVIHSPSPHVVLQDINPAIGRGWFAANNHPIPAGTTLWGERPLVVASTRHELIQTLVEEQQQNMKRCQHLCRPSDNADNNNNKNNNDQASIAAGIVHCNHFVHDDHVLLLDKISLLNHSCHPNASVSITISNYDDNNKESKHSKPKTSGSGSSSNANASASASASILHAHVRTARDIPVGEQITISYSPTALFWPRDKRRDYLQAQWGFACGCDRCCSANDKLSKHEQELWDLLEQAAAAAESAKPRRQQVDPAIKELQQRAAEAVAQQLPYLAEGGRFAMDVEYFS